MVSKQVMWQALDALESVAGKGKKCDAAITALRAALDAPEREPLSDERIVELVDSKFFPIELYSDYIAFARAIEQEVRGRC